MTDTTPYPSPLEEQFNGEGTGVELERAADTEDGSPVRPWDPDKIRVSTKSFSLRNIVDMINGEDLELAPDFQRNRVWKVKQKSRLVESLLLQIPLPAFYFAEDVDGALHVVDGLQRLSTIHGFVAGSEFKLKELEYLEECNGMTFAQLGPALQRRVLNTQIVAHVIDPSTPEDVKYDIFKRINTGGEPLNAMEIRHSMSRKRGREFLKRCTRSELFIAATGGSLVDHIRMQDREAALRFVAFQLLDRISDYEEYGSLEKLLNWAAAQIDDPVAVPDEKLDRIFDQFESAMSNAIVVFGRHAFRKWPEGDERLFPINRALFESWSIALADEDPGDLERAASGICEQFRRAISLDADYVDTISTGTGDPRKVRARFRFASAVIEEAYDAS